MSLSPSLCPSGAGGAVCLVGTSVVLGSFVPPAPGSVVGPWYQELAQFYCSDRLRLRCGQLICRV